MTDKVFEADLEILNQKGLHARAAAAFVKTIENMDADVKVARLGQEVDGCSIMGLMMLSAFKGTTIHVKVSGAQAEEAFAAIKLLVNSKFGEE